MEKKLEDESELMKKILFDKNKNTDKLVHALEIVKDFIINHNLILVGGMAIDLALKLKGKKLYSDYVLPDYDFYSPIHHEHAYELGEILCRNDMPNVSIIPASHVTTMRVRVDFEVVADITYCPSNIYNDIPTVVYNRIRVIHPHFQMIDQHMSLSRPFENTGYGATIFARWENDCKRYDKLLKEYPIQAEKQKISETQVTIKLADIQTCCLIGWAGMYYWKYIYGKKEIKDKITICIPKQSNVSILSYNIERLLTKWKDRIKTVSYYNSYFEKMPRRVNVVFKTGEIYEIYDTSTRKISAKKINNFYDIYVANLQYIMLNMLFYIYRNDIKHDKKLIEYAKYNYIECIKMIDNASKNEITTDSMDLLPSIEVYGNSEYSTSYIKFRRQFYNKVFDKPKEYPNPLPAYPDNPECRVNKQFNPETSKFFSIDGKLVDKFEPETIDFVNISELMKGGEKMTAVSSIMNKL